MGMLWLDDDPDLGLLAKVTRAAEHYARKHGKPPNVCYVHPSALGGDEAVDGPVPILPLETVLPHHLWLGVSDTRARKRRRRRRRKASR